MTPGKTSSFARIIESLCGKSGFLIFRINLQVAY